MHCVEKTDLPAMEALKGHGVVMASVDYQLQTVVGPI
jgi:hypothetical protein